MPVTHLSVGRLVTSFKGIRSKSVEPVSHIMYDKGFVDLAKEFERGDSAVSSVCVCLK